MDRTPETGSLEAAVNGDASERIALEIRSYLARKSLQPGDRVGSEHELAAEFGVSRPTIREALRLLASSNLVRSVRGRSGGIFVASTPSDEISRTLTESIATALGTRDLSLRELMDSWLHLAVPLAGLAATNATTDTILKLGASIADREGQPPSTRRFRLADACFHRTLAASAANPLLGTFTTWTLDALHPSLFDLVGDALDGSQILGQHRKILRAVQRRRPADAEQAMRDHLGYLSERLRALEECPDAQ